MSNVMGTRLPAGWAIHSGEVWALFAAANDWMAISIRRARTGDCRANAGLRDPVRGREHAGSSGG